MQSNGCDKETSCFAVAQTDTSLSDVTTRNTGICLNSYIYMNVLLVNVTGQ